MSDAIIRKFTEVFSADDWEVATDTGWQSLVDVKQTTEYQIWQLILDNGIILECADTHIVFDQHLNQRFVCDLQVGDFVLTDSGPTALSSVTTVESREHMYDLGVDSSNHRYYTNGILSHNTSTAAGYLLWQAMFHGDQTILIAAHKSTGAQEIMQRIRYGYELCPDFIRPGVVNYNKGSIEFDNGSRIVATTTTETTGRGMSISLLYCLDGDTQVKIRNKRTGEIEDISLRDLHARIALKDIDEDG